MKKWNLEQKRAFTKAMGRQKLSKGGLIRRMGNRKYFDDGGKVTAFSDPTQPDPAANLSGPGGGGVNGAGSGQPNNPINLLNSYQAAGANLQPGTNTAQLQNIYNQAQQGLAQQQAVAGQLQPGVTPAVASQEQLLQDLQNQSQGIGPNPAQAELAQNTAANTANQAALMASQRGASANAGLIARQAAQQGALNQQNAVGQAATLQAQQQLAARQQLAGLQGQIIGQGVSGAQAANQAAQNEQNILQGANTNYNNANVSMQTAIDQANAQTSIANQGSIGSLIGAVAGGASAAAPYIAGLFAKGGEIESPEKMAAGGVAAAGSELQAPTIGQGGTANPGAGGYTAPTSVSGPTAMGQINVPQYDIAGASAKAGKFVKDYMDKKVGAPGSATNMSDDQIQADTLNANAQLGVAGADNPVENLGASNFDQFNSFAEGGYCHGPHGGHVANYLFAEGGKVPAMVSPGEIYLSPEKVRQVVHEGANPFKVGMKIPGKPKVKGKDSVKNDIVPMDLEEGGVVVPIHETKKMNPESAELFVHRAIARKKARK